MSTGCVLDHNFIAPLVCHILDDITPASKCSFDDSPWFDDVWSLLLTRDTILASGDIAITQTNVDTSPAPSVPTKVTYAVSKKKKVKKQKITVQVR